MAVLRNKIVGDLSGSVGGMTFSKNRSGGIVKFKSTNKNRNTTKQAQNRNSFTQSNSAWHTLTDAQKMLWNAKNANSDITGINNMISCFSNFKTFDSLILRNLSLDRYQNAFDGDVFSVYKILYFNKIPNPNVFLNQFSYKDLSANRISLLKLANSTFTFKLQINFNNLPISVPIKNIFQNSNLVNFGILLEFKNFGSQKSNYNSNDYTPFLSLGNYSESVTRTRNYRRIEYTFQNSVLYPRLTKFDLFNKDVTYRFSLISEYGDKIILNTVVFNFST